MKRIIYAGILIITIFSACSKILDTTPKSFLSPGAYYTGSNLTSALVGVYNPLTLYGNDYVKGLFTCNDETFWGGAGRVPSGAPNATYFYDYSNSNVNSLWSGLYTGIERANELIANVNATDSSKATQAALGEAIFLRAYYYFLLTSNFGPVPLKLTPTTSPNGLGNPRVPLDTLYDFIVKDMKTAESKVYTAAQLGYASRVAKTTVEGILARVYLFMAGYPFNGGKAGVDAMYDSSLVYAQKVVSSGLHSLNSSYNQIFINQAADIYDVKESMWEADFSGGSTSTFNITGGVGAQNGIQFTSAATYPGSSNFIYSDSGYSYGFVYVTQKLYNLYSVYDARRDWNIQNFNYSVNTAQSPIVTRTPLSNTAVFSYNRNNAKWRRTYETVYPKGKNTSVINFPILRYSDVLLMLAEADLNVNHGTISANGLNAINAVRERGYGLTGGTAPIKALTITNSGSGYNTTSFSGYNNASLGDVNQGNSLGYASAITGGKVTAVTLTSGGQGFTAATAGTIYLGNPWTANKTYAVNQQVINNGNLYTVTTAGTSTSTPPTQTTGASSAAATGAVFTYAGVAATASGTLVTKADVDLATVSMKDIQDERARELCYEGVRTNDLIRWNIFYTTMTDVYNQINSWPTFATNTKAIAIFGYNNVVSATPNKFLLLPIPSSEISVNKSMTQNPGW
ncbi:MAG: RagB/SusD family nutrient uptake outer membrane protein [Niabella sp.]|nr:RagB/SusD family nutrient uptake outer membrane protein [Niabella sp.]